MLQELQQHEENRHHVLVENTQIVKSMLQICSEVDVPVQPLHCKIYFLQLLPQRHGDRDDLKVLVHLPHQFFQNMPSGFQSG